MFSKKILWATLALGFFFLFLIGCSDRSDRQEVIPGGNLNVREWLLEERTVVMPPDVHGGDSFFHKVVVVYGPQPPEWREEERKKLIWVSGNKPDSQISFMFFLDDP